MFIKRTKSDELFYREHLNESEKMQDVVKAGEEHHYAFEDIAQDLYTMLYEPTPTDEDAPTPVGLAIVKQAIDQIKELREYQDLHRMTKLDALSAGFATESMGKAVLQFLPKVPESPEQLKDKAEVAKEFGYDKEAAKAEEEAAKVQAYLDKINPRKLTEERCRQDVRAALQQALQGTIDAMEGLEAFGHGTDPGSLKQSGLKEKMELAKRLRNSDKLKKIAKMAGRFITIAKKKQREKMVTNTVSSIKMGDNLARTLPSELAKLTNPVTAGMFYKSYLEKTLLNYDLHGKVPQGQGPIIYIMDGSGSMGEGCFPELATKAIGMALAEIARHQKRDFIMAQFGSKDQYRDVQILANGSMIVEDGKGGHSTKPYSGLHLMAELEFFFGGGTDFQRPLSEAISYIGGHKFKRADIIFATDGCANLTPEFVAEYQKLKAAKSFSCLGILVAPGSTDARDAPAVMAEFCDEVFPVDDLLNTDAKNEALHDKMFSI